MRKIIFNIAILLLIFISSCNKEEPIPAYIRINQINFITDYATKGSSSNKIVDAWVYVDGKSVGTFELPVTFPVLAEGTKDIIVYPGIKENGISVTRIQYPFYNIFEQKQSLVPAEITVLNPVTDYVPSADFAWIEDFEGSGISLCDTMGSDTTMKLITDKNIVFERNGCGGVFLSGNNIFYQGITCNKYVLSVPCRAFLELDYKCNKFFAVGIVAYSSSNILGQVSSGIINAKETWNKIYMNLSNEINLFPNATSFAIYFAMLNTDTSTPAYLYLDNIKLIH
ncbi:MAG: hypothetical protein V1781_01915 [Bacteroidota bacterium]